LVLAAGMGSRYGGLKQADPVTERGEFLLDFTIYDALLAGFCKVVFVIRAQHEALFRATVGDRISAAVAVEYARQEPDDLPQGFMLPEGRAKPWGTAHAVRAARALIDAPFATVNADDFYGRESLALAADFLRQDADGGAMVAFRLENTLTDHGTVSRGECTARGDSLVSIVERLRVARVPELGTAWEDDSRTWHPLPPDTPVSMNLFALPASFTQFADSGFERWLQSADNLQKDEYLLPRAVDSFIASGGTVKLLLSPERWFGVTYPQDKDRVVAALREMRQGGLYPERLF
jgi:hypothetical protein